MAMNIALSANGAASVPARGNAPGQISSSKLPAPKARLTNVLESRFQRSLIIQLISSDVAREHNEAALSALKQ
jgi:hypothetical protein